MLSQIKDHITKIFRPIIIFFANLGIHPNVFTFLGMTLSISAGIFFYMVNFLAGFILIILGGICDFLDGGIARYNNIASKKGSFLDSIADRISDLAIFGGIALSGTVDGVTGILMLTSGLLISYIRAKGESIGIEKMAVGIMERAERLLFLMLLVFLHLLIPEFHQPFFQISWIGFTQGSYFSIGYMILTSLSVITVIQRFVYGSIQLKEPEDSKKELIA